MHIDPRILHISTSLYSRFFKQNNFGKQLTVFLCGGVDSKSNFFRKEIGSALEKLPSKYRYSVFYPEDMFIDQILGHQRKDLLGLENLLANSVHTVIILLHSPGTFTELGAFTNFKGLDKKIIVVQNEKYKNSQSFINLGPIRHLKRNFKKRIIYTKENLRDFRQLVSNISESIREVAKVSSPKKDLSNPIYAYEFLLSLIYVLDPIKKLEITELSEKISGLSHESINTSVETSINSLINERKVQKVFINGAEALSITQKGVDGLIFQNKTEKLSQSILQELTEFRLESMNIKLRKKIWGRETRILV